MNSLNTMGCTAFDGGGGVGRSGRRKEFSQKRIVWHSNTWRRPVSNPDLQPCARLIREHVVRIQFSQSVRTSSKRKSRNFPDYLATFGVRGLTGQRSTENRQSLKFFLHPLVHNSVRKCRCCLSEGLGRVMWCLQRLDAVGEVARLCPATQKSKDSRGIIYNVQKSIRESRGICHS